MTNAMASKSTMFSAVTMWTITTQIECIEYNFETYNGFKKDIIAAAISSPFDHNGGSHDHARTVLSTKCHQNLLRYAGNNTGPMPWILQVMLYHPALMN